MNFYTIVLIIAIILLILILTGLGLMMNAGTTNAFPSYSNSCPDGWSGPDANGHCSTSGTNMPSKYESDGTYSHNSPGYINYFYSSGSFADGVSGTYATGSTTVLSNLRINTNILKNVCDQKAWANTNQIQWDGVTNSNAKC